MTTEAPRELPLLGAPLAGKTTILAQAALAHGATVDRRIYDVQVPGPFLGVATAIVSTTLRVAGHDVLLWCLPGGSEFDWPLPLVHRSSPVIWVFDAQAAIEPFQSEWWQQQARATAASNSLALITKADLAEARHSLDVLPSDLHHRPFARVCGLTDRGRARIGALLFAHLPSLVAGLRPGDVARLDILDAASPDRYLQRRPSG